ncbi:MAG: dihydroorotate dehydrogenase [Candidatus Omnitrophica bacterium]|nr:dihydroorotate dehydrogenase [Candidatus Omnitrophota bacterium]
MNLAVRFGALELRNPVTVASGTFGYGREFAELVDLRALGAIITKTITRQPRQGNPQPRLAETAAGMLNAIGLQNEGLENFLREKWPQLREYGAPVIVSISAQDAADFAAMASTLEQAGVQAVELNLSCPNVAYAKLAAGAAVYAQIPEAVAEIVARVRQAVSLTIFAKLSPNVTDIVPIARAAETAGADALSLVNTVIGMAIDIDTWKPKVANVTGGLSGPAIKPIAVRMVHAAAKAVSIPVLGMGGIAATADAVEFLLAGATAISVGTANFVNPAVSMEILAGIEQYCLQRNFSDIRELIGKVRV